jgi:hypothetical protein
VGVSATREVTVGAGSSRGAAIPRFLDSLLLLSFALGRSSISFNRSSLSGSQRSSLSLIHNSFLFFVIIVLPAA